MIILFAAEDGKALYSQQKQDLELTVAQIMSFLLSKFRLKLEKEGKAIRTFRYDLNQISKDYIVQVINRFKGLDLINRVPEELQTEVCNTVQEAVTATIPKKKKCKKTKWLSEQALQITERRRDMKGKGQRERYTGLNGKFQ